MLQISNALKLKAEVEKWQLLECLVGSLLIFVSAFCALNSNPIEVNFVFQVPKSIRRKQGSTRNNEFNSLLPN